MYKSPFDKETKEKVKKLYTEGLPIREICRLTGVSSATIYDWIGTIKRRQTSGNFGRLKPYRTGKY